MPARSVCLATLSLSEAGPGRFGDQVSVTNIYHTIPYHNMKTVPNIYAKLGTLCAIKLNQPPCML